MGKIIRPNWDEREPKKPVTKTYLGYGYWIDTLRDGTKILVKEKGVDYFLPLGKCQKFTDDGHPIWE